MALTSSEETGGNKQPTGYYVYGIVPADVELAAGTPGVGNPPGEVYLVRHESIAALVSEVSLAGPLGTPDDLRAHAQLLDAAAAGVPVLPLRFGTVMTSGDAVAGELLSACYDDFIDALAHVEGYAEYLVKGRYAEQAVLAEVLGQIPQAARLAAEIHGKDEHATRNHRIALGEIINQAITAKREADTAAVGDVVAPYCQASLVREPSHELDAVNVALLVDTTRQAGLEQAITELARDWEGRAELRLVGPLAPWDFVQPPAPPA